MIMVHKLELVKVDPDDTGLLGESPACVWPVDHPSPLHVHTFLLFVTWHSSVTFTPKITWENLNANNIKGAMHKVGDRQIPTLWVGTAYTFSPVTDKKK